MNTTQETLDLIKAATGNGSGAELYKAYTQSTGLVNYDLQRPSLNLFPYLISLQKRIPRVGANGGTAANWKAVTAINTANTSIGVSEGNRGGVMSVTAVDKLATYKGIGLEDFVTFEAGYAGEGFEDLRSTGMQRLLAATMIQEERVLTGGNSSIALGTTPTPTVVGSTTGGTLGAQTISVICVALTLDGLKGASISGGLPLSGTRTNADGSTDTINAGTAQKSAAGTAALTGSTASFTATVTVVNGAVAYAWYWGVGGSELLGAITTVNTVQAIANAAGTQNASAGFTTDRSQNSLVFDGLIPQILAPGSGAYVYSMPTAAGTGTALTSDGANGIVEIENAFASFWANYKLSPTDIDVSGTTFKAISTLIVANNGLPLARLSNDSSSPLQVTGGASAIRYLNKITGTVVNINVMPEMPDGMILFYSRSINYPLAGINNIIQVKTRKDYYATEWPQRSRKYEFGIYADEVLQNYFPPAFGIIRNVKV